MKLLIVCIFATIALAQGNSTKPQGRTAPAQVVEAIPYGFPVGAPWAWPGAMPYGPIIEEIPVMAAPRYVEPVIRAPPTTIIEEVLAPRVIQVEKHDPWGPDSNKWAPGVYNIDNGFENERHWTYAEPKNLGHWGV